MRLNNIEIGMMRARNSSVSLPPHEIVGRVQEPLPANFPTTLAELLAISNEHCTFLLNHYSIAVRRNAPVTEKRMQLAIYLGIRRSCLP
mmetsp:Transcript_19184/g.27432  ORF Transcript_19184/g.27432 Transcript_19184/m.27432 type:complete len:89 (-) Transcript_19184:103-369(-)